MIQLTEDTAVLAGGAPQGASMCQAFKRFVQEEGLKGIEQIYASGLAFLASKYEEFMRKECEILPLDPFHHVHFIIAGRTLEQGDDPYRMYMLWTKRKLPQLDGDRIAEAYAVPRRMGLEYRLNQLCRRKAPLSQALDLIRKDMEKSGEQNEEVGPPYAFALINEEGFKELE
jgi:hypothetical protein